MSSQLPPNSLSSLAEFKRELVAPAVGGVDLSALMYDCLGRSADVIESYLNRRLIYRGGSVLDATGLVNAATLATGALALAGQPSSVVTLLYDVVSGSPTAGKVVVTGTDNFDAAVTETFTLTDETVYGVKGFKTVTSAVVSGLTGAGTISIGFVNPYVEYHSIQSLRNSLYCGQKPLIAIFEVNEDRGLNYGSATRLSQGNFGFVYDVKTAKITKTKGGINMDFPEDIAFRYPATYGASWFRGYRSVRVKYVAGYAMDGARANVPARLKTVHLQLAVLFYREIQRKQQNLSSVSDAAGSTSRYQAAGITKEMREFLKDEISVNTMGDFERDYV